MAYVTTRRTFGLGTAALLAGAVLPAVLPPGRARASKFSTPTGAVVLSITGRIDLGNDEDGSAHFDRPMLEALGMTELLTSCPWFDGQIRFGGVRMDRLLDYVGARGDRVVASGHGQPTAELPRADLSLYGVIVATRLNGAVVSTHNIGPLFVVYPYDSCPELKQQQYYDRSSWQVTRLNIL